MNANINLRTVYNDSNTVEEKLAFVAGSRDLDNEPATKARRAGRIRIRVNQSDRDHLEEDRRDMRVEN